MSKVMPVYHKINTLQREGDHWQWGGEQLCKNGDFSNMPEGKALFSVLDSPDTACPPGVFKMTTRRGNQFNAMIFSKKDTLQGGEGRGDVFISPQDAKRLGFSENDAIRLVNEHGSFDGVVRLMNIAAGFVQTYWPETNNLIPPVWDPLSEEPDYNCLVRIERG